LTERRIVEGLGATKRVIYEVPATMPGSLAGPQLFGDWVYFSWHAGDGGITSFRRVRASGGGAAEDVVLGPGLDPSYPAVSPDGTKLAYETDSMGLGLHEIVFFDVIGRREVRRIPARRADGWNAAHDLMWAPDNVHVFDTIQSPTVFTDCRNGARLEHFPGLEDPGATGHIAMDEHVNHPMRLDSQTGTIENAQEFGINGSSVAITVRAGSPALIVNPLPGEFPGFGIPDDSPDLDFPMVDINTGETVPFIAHQYSEANSQI